MNVSALQVIVVVFALFAWSRAVLRLRDRKISLGEFVFWSVIWAAVIATSVLPKAADIAADLFGVSRPIDLAIYVSIILLFYLIFRIYVMQEQQTQDITRFVRELALKYPKHK